jgi:hypothetical protein
VGALVCRAAHLHAGITSLVLRHVNATWIIMGVIAVPFILMMAYSVDTDGGIHFIGAGIGMGLISISGIVHSVLCLFLFSKGCNVDQALALRRPIYVLQGLLLLIGLLCFGIWFSSDKSSASLEWTGFIMVMVAYSTYSSYFVWAPEPLSLSTEVKVHVRGEHACHV